MKVKKMAIDQRSIDSVKQAKAQIAEGSLTIWNARLDAMISAGDVTAAIAHMRSPIERTGDQCDCGCGQGLLLPQALTTPSPT